MKKTALILTLNDYIIYQPSILNLYDFMQDRFDVTIVSFLPHHNTKNKDETRKIIYLETNFFLRHFFQKTDFLFSILNASSLLFRRVTTSFMLIVFSVFIMISFWAVFVVSIWVY